ncbi:DUF3108 domain-containing protein [bacterium]|nr:DUF3108 domain-containing protein [bacterium]
MVVLVWYELPSLWKMLESEQRSSRQFIPERSIIFSTLDFNLRSNTQLKTTIMKGITFKIILAGLVALVLAFSIPSKVSFDSFEKGEKLKYKVKYNLYINVPVAEIQFSFNDELKEFNGQQCLHFSAAGQTYRFYDHFFPVRDYFNAYVDPVTFKPRVFTRNISEGDYKKQDYTLFYPEQKYVKNKKGEKFDVPKNTWDILSVWYLARTFNYENMHPGDSVKMNTFIDNKTYPIGLQYIGKEEVKTDAGKINCYIIKPLLIAGEIFKSEDDMTLWVSADANKIPVIIESGISVGRVRAELTSYSGLKHSFSALKK